MKRSLLAVAAGVSGAMAVCGVFQPINSTFLRLVTVGAVVAFYAAVLMLCWRVKVLRWAWLAVPAIPLLVVALPGREPDVGKLREAYVAALPRYTGAGYVWGGEGRMGIDCSGLPRTALRDALFTEGLRTANGRLIREAIRQWWFDASARALSEGYRDYMIPLFPAKALRSADFSTLKPGDVAITATGVHCLVYLRGDSWIQADPAVGRGESFDARSTDNAWFDDSVKLYRWSVLK